MLRLKSIHGEDVMVNTAEIVLAKSLGSDKVVIFIRGEDSITVMANFNALQDAIIEKSSKLKDRPMVLTVIDSNSEKNSKVSN